MENNKRIINLKIISKKMIGYRNEKEIQTTQQTESFNQTEDFSDCKEPVDEKCNESNANNFVSTTSVSPKRFQKEYDGLCSTDYPNLTSKTEGASSILEAKSDEITINSVNKDINTASITKQNNGSSTKNKTITRHDDHEERKPQQDENYQQWWSPKRNLSLNFRKRYQNIKSIFKSTKRDNHKPVCRSISADNERTNYSSDDVHFKVQQHEVRKDQTKEEISSSNELGFSVNPSEKEVELSSDVNISEQRRVSKESKRTLSLRDRNNYNQVKTENEETALLRHSSKNQQLNLSTAKGCKKSMSWRTDLRPISLAPLSVIKENFFKSQRSLNEPKDSGKVIMEPLESDQNVDIAPKQTKIEENGLTLGSLQDSNGKCSDDVIRSNSLQHDHSSFEMPVEQINSVNKKDDNQVHISSDIPQKLTKNIPRNKSTNKIVSEYHSKICSSQPQQNQNHITDLQVSHNHHCYYYNDVIHKHINTRSFVHDNTDSTGSVLREDNTNNGLTERRNIDETIVQQDYKDSLPTRTISRQREENKKCTERDKKEKLYTGEKHCQDKVRNRDGDLRGKASSTVCQNQQKPTQGKTSSIDTKYRDKPVFGNLTNNKKHSERRVDNKKKHFDEEPSKREANVTDEGLNWNNDQVKKLNSIGESHSCFSGSNRDCSYNSDITKFVQEVETDAHQIKNHNNNSIIMKPVGSYNQNRKRSDSGGHQSQKYIYFVEATTTSQKRDDKQRGNNTTRKKYQGDFLSLSAGSESLKDLNNNNSNYLNSGSDSIKNFSCVQPDASGKLPRHKDHCERNNNNNKNISYKHCKENYNSNDNKSNSNKNFVYTPIDYIRTNPSRDNKHSNRISLDERMLGHMIVTKPYAIDDLYICSEPFKTRKDEKTFQVDLYQRLTTSMNNGTSRDIRSRQHSEIVKSDKLQQSNGSEILNETVDSKQGRVSANNNKGEKLSPRKNGISKEGDLSKGRPLILTENKEDLHRMLEKSASTLGDIPAKNSQQIPAATKKTSKIHIDNKMANGLHPPQVNGFHFPTTQEVRLIIESMLEEKLRDKLFDNRVVTIWCKDISNTLRDQLKHLTHNERKVIVSTYIGPKTDEGAHVSIQCQQETQNDNFTTVAFEGKDYFVWVSLLLAAI